MREDGRTEDGRTDGRMDGLTHTPSRTRACKHTNACIDERTHIWKNERAREQTDGRTDSHIRPHARAGAHTRTLACLHAHTMH